MEVTSGDKTWRIEIRARRCLVDDLYVEYTEARLAFGSPAGYNNLRLNWGWP